MKTLITGATGFVGQALVEYLWAKKVDIVASVRQQSTLFAPEIQQCILGDIDQSTDWQYALKNVDVVVHLAARVHLMAEHSIQPLEAYRQLNVVATLNLAQQAVQAGVSRFIFISSIKLNGEKTEGGKKFSPDDDCAPVDPYSVSKYEAEQALLQLANNTSLDVVIIRPPLIYGVGVKANFQRLISWVDRGVPLPLGAVMNQRSLLALDNLVDFIYHCFEHPLATHQIFLIADTDDVSTTQLLQQVAASLHQKSLLLPVPVGILKLLARLVGKQTTINRLVDCLQVDSSKAQQLLGWQAVVSMREQLQKMHSNNYR